MRSFVAIDFNKELKIKLADLQSGLRKWAVSGRWKYVDNFHLTLKFLGEIKPESVGNIDKKLLGICNGFKEFKLKFSSLEYFPGKKSIRVLWLGLEGDVDELINLQEEIDIQLKSIGFKPEKRNYIPHITIGQDVVFIDEFENIKRMFTLNELPEIAVKSVYLFKSEQINCKRVYTPISEYDFAIK